MSRHQSARKRTRTRAAQTRRSRRDPVVILTAAILVVAVLTLAVILLAWRFPVPVPPSAVAPAAAESATQPSRSDTTDWLRDVHTGGSGIGTISVRLRPASSSVRRSRVLSHVAMKSAKCSVSALTLTCTLGSVFIRCT